MKTELIRTNSDNFDFRELVKELDADLKIRDGDKHSFFAQFNKIDLIKHVVIAYIDEKAVGCGAIKNYSDDTMEVKRMYVNPDFRGNRIGKTVLDELEIWTKELGYKKCILETGMMQPEAITLYKRNNFIQIENYGQYKEDETSVCFEKMI
ncbi:GNAT family N-acetyltransferase [Algoriella sp.]|uniref:GNAT family N-acetyltransferase n=1 Tax=Algoriella sp. TaxID=1872434 RepID=UPI001B020661|nr:GNAT family N-acetyltransferase [Algoriella sp.]MBO6212600.1 GNAT family N-acetyltransferase [Algoriella sp.]